VFAPLLFSERDLLPELRIQASMADLVVRFLLGWLPHWMRRHVDSVASNTVKATSPAGKTS